MASFNGIDQYLSITGGLNTGSNDNVKIRITLASDFVEDLSEQRYLFEGRTEANPAGGYIYYQAGSSEAQRAGAYPPSPALVDGLVAGSTIVFDTFDHLGVFALFASPTYGGFTAVDVSLVEVISYDQTIVLHSWDLSNPTNATPVTTGSIGDAVLTLHGFTFEVSASLDVTVNNPYIYTAPTVVTDTNSIFNGQFYSAGSRFWMELTGVNASKVTVDQAGAESGSLWANDVNDFMTPEAGFSGDVGITLHVWDADSSTVASVSGTVTVTASGEADTEKPVITLIGSAIINHTVDTAYTDAGANVTDNVDADAVLVAQGSVNTSALGAYTLTYNYTDAAGNVADTVTRTVTVVPRQLTGTLVDSAGSTPADMTGLSITLYVTAEDLQLNTNPVITLTGVALTGGVFTVTTEEAVGTYFMRLFDPLDYSNHAFGQIEVT